MNDLIHILDGQTDEIVGVLSTKNADYWADERTDSLTNENTFDFIANAKKPLAAQLKKRNRLLIQDEDGYFREYIIFYAKQYKRTEKNIRSNASWADLATANVIPPQVLQGSTAGSAAQFAVNGSEWQIGIVDYAGINSMTIENYTNPLDLLKTIASTFGLELSFRIEIKGNMITGRYVDLKYQVAGFEGKEIVFGKDLQNVTRNEDASQIVTALTGLGPVKEDGTRLTVTVYDPVAKARWGRKGLDIIKTYEPQSTDTDMTLDRLQTLTQNELQKRVDAIVSYECDAASIEEVPGLKHEKIREGQTIRIKDEGYQPPLYLEARIQEVKREQSTGKLKSFKIGNFVEFQKWQLIQQIINLKAFLTNRIKKLITCSIDSSAGNVFKNGSGSTTLTAKVFISGAEVDADGSLYSYNWTKRDKNGNLVAGYSKTTKSITVTQADITENATFVVLIDTNAGANTTAQYTISIVNDGAQGPTGGTGASAIVGVISNEAATVPADPSGTVTSFSGATTTFSIFEGSADVSSGWTVTAGTPVGLGGSLSGKTYTVSSMSADTGYIDLTASKAGYSSITKRFIVTKTKTGAQGTTGAQGPTGPIGPTGPTGPAGKDGIAYMGQSAPSNPGLNMTWFQTDSGGKVIAIKKYNGTSWDTTKFDQSTLSVQKLSALTADLGSIIAGDITGVTMNLANGKFIVDVDGNVTFKGNLEGANGTFYGTMTVVKGQNKTMIYENIYNEYIDNTVSNLKYYMLVQNGTITVSRESLINSNYDTVTVDSSQIRLANNFYSTVFLTNNGGRLGVQGGIKTDVIESINGNPVVFPKGIQADGGIITQPFTAFTFGNNWVNYGGAYPPAGYTKAADGLVILRGAVKGGTFANASGLAVCTLPVGYRPPYDAAFNGIDNDNRSVTIIVRASTGYVQVYSCQNYNGSAMVASNNGFISFEGIRFQT